MRYRWKLTSFTTGEKNRAQNCLTVSNFKLDDVFSDVFGKAASAITTRILENPAAKITDVSGFRTKRMKATDEEILAAVDGEMCAEQAEKLRIIRSHMDSLELCKLNLDSLILSTAEKYLPQLGLVMTAPGIQSFAAIGIISEIGVDMSVFPTSKHLCSWAGLTPQNNESAGKKKTTRISRAGAYIKPLLVQCALCAIRAKQFPKSETATSLSKSAVDTRKRLLLSPECCSLQFTICSRRMNPTILNSTERATGRLHTVRFLWKKPSSFYNGKVT